MIWRQNALESTVIAMDGFNGPSKTGLFGGPCTPIPSLLTFIARDIWFIIVANSAYILISKCIVILARASALLWLIWVACHGSNSFLVVFV